MLVMEKEKEGVEQAKLRNIDLKTKLYTLQKENAPQGRVTADPLTSKVAKLASSSSILLEVGCSCSKPTSKRFLSSLIIMSARSGGS